ncbi:ABC transporter, substrate-binding protein, family 3 [Bacteriovorax sp. Seq25_V]|nr:ABC transporter, substrate-binding protein, family 3 [Bacteriovorax sp. Seq25_V]
MFTALSKQPYIILSGDWEPYTGVNLKNHGIANNIVSHVMNQVNEKVEFHFVPWTRTLNLVLSNRKYIASSAWAYSEEKAKLYAYSDPFINNPENLFYIKDRDKVLEWNELSDLKKVKASFGGTRSYLHSKVLGEAGVNLDIANSDLLNFKKLLAGRINYFPCNPTVGLEIIKKYFPEEQDRFAYIKKPIMNISLGLVVDKKNPEGLKFIEKFNKGLKIIKANGELNKIFEEHSKNKELIELFHHRSASILDTNSSHYP